MKRLEKRTSGTIRGATKRVENEKPKRPKKPRKWTKKHMATRWCFDITGTHDEEKWIFTVLAIFNKY